MIGVLIVPTGIEAKIGGHAGDANPVAKLIGACCDKLITHPNVVNASDINEMPENTLYVEGSILDRFLENKIGLKEVYQNKILVVVNKPVREDTINAVNAAKVTIGINAHILELDTPLEMKAVIKDGVAGGEVTGVDELVNQLVDCKYDAVAIHTPINVDRDIALNYYRKGGVNPWGGIEAKASKMIANKIDVPVAHAPLENVTSEDTDLYYIFNEVVNSRIAPEAISNCYLHCVLKGLNKAPRIIGAGKGIEVQDVDFLVSPDGCFGIPHRACLELGIPVIIVKENKTVLNKKLSKACVFVENYWEAVGVIMSMKAGINKNSVRYFEGQEN